MNIMGYQPRRLEKDERMDKIKAEVMSGIVRMDQYIGDITIPKLGPIDQKMHSLYGILINPGECPGCGALRPSCGPCGYCGRAF